MNEWEKEFSERLEKELKEKKQKEKERAELKEKKQKEKEYQNWKNAKLISENSAKVGQPITGEKITWQEQKVFVGLILILIFSLLFLFKPEKKFGLSVVEGLQKIQINEAMEICGQDKMGIKYASLDLEIALNNLSEDEGLELYIDDNFKKHFYHIIGWSDGSKNTPEQDQELRNGCTQLINNDENFSKEFNRIWSKRLKKANDLELAKNAQASADNLKFRPQLEKWNNKLSNLGGGDLRDYLAASAETYNFIRQGAAYSLTGAARGAVQSVSCDPTNRSRWSSGVPTGWWSCLIDFEGSDYEVFSIEFTENSWRGVPDRGRQAGTDLKNMEIPQDLIEWLSKNS